MGVMAGRDVELQQVTALIDQARDHGRGVLITGEAGIGKSTLVEAVAARCAATTTCVISRASAVVSPPFLLWRPVLTAVAPDVHLPWADETHATREQVFAATVDLLRQARNDRPAVLVLEDLHWADASSLALLRFVVDVLSMLPVALVMTVREPLEADSPAEVLGRLPTSVARMPLTGLDRDGTAAIVHELLGPHVPATMIDTVQQRTDGNPFFVSEVARLHALQGARAAAIVPPGVRQVVDQRLAHLSQEAVATLSSAAVLGEIDVAVIAEAAGTPVELVQAHVDEAVRAGLVVTGSQGLAFNHAIVSEVLVDGLGSRLGLVHRRCALALEGRTGQLDVLTRLAHHWSRADGPGAAARAAEHARAAAEGALAQMAYEQATALFDIALGSAAPTPPELLAGAGEAKVMAGEFTGGRALLRQAVRAALDLGDAVLAGRAALAMGGGVGGFEVDITDLEQPVLLRRILAELPEEPSPLRAAVTARLSVATTLTDSVQARTRLAEQALALSASTDDPSVGAAVLAAYCDAIAGPDHVRRRHEAATEMLDLAERAGDVRLVLHARRLRLLASLEVGDIAAVDREIAAYAQRVARLHAPLYEWPVPIWRGMRALLDGDVEAAKGFLQQARELQGRTDSANVAAMVFTLDLAVARAEGDEASRLPAVLGYVEELQGYPQAAMFLAGTLARSGRTDVAAQMVNRVMSLGLAEVPQDAEWLEAMWSLGDAAMAVGDGDVVAEVTDALEPYARLWAIDGIGGAVFGVVAHQLARLTAHLGDQGAADDWLQLAASIYRDAGTAALTAQLEPLLAPPPLAAVPAATATFMRDGAVWRLRWREVDSVVRHTKGMADLATLLSAPDTDVDALSLAGTPGQTAFGGDTGPMIDDQARRAYRQRLADLDIEIAEAEADADIERASRRRQERDQLLDELGRVIGLGGRARRAGDGRDRARKAVTMRIRTALALIEGSDPALARHLRNAVSTGRFCHYRPEEPVTWMTGATVTSSRPG